MVKNKLQQGDTVKISRIINDKDIESFAELSFDRNKVHFDDEFASKTFFGKRIAHGMLGVALVSGALTKLMGDGNIWLSSSITFEKPIFIGDEITCVLTVKEIDRRKIALIEIEIKNSNNEKIISGNVKSMRFGNS
ncbi:MaoC family dehydratase [Desulfobacula sp.]|uniref:MaoC family dehydratase n=1 Tax=Desulfobacula sp. TaxID=2593537 RepID=UPI002714698D|nr:MaoC family dehydratase [Desulfobacula sp.]